MDDNHSHLSLYGKSPLYQLFVSLLIILVVGMFLFFDFYLAGTLIFDGIFGNLLENASPEVSEKDIGFPAWSNG